LNSNIFETALKTSETTYGIGSVRKTGPWSKKKNKCGNKT
jgi:hypothetical protein